MIQFGPAKYTINGTQGIYNSSAPLKGNITSTYGAHEPFRVEMGLSPHGGVDIDDNLKANAPILAPAPGEVVEVGYNDDVGHFIRINHGEGVVSKYLHMESDANDGLNDLSVPDWVTRGQQIGNVGTTGRWSSGPHLHWSCRVNGVLVDPLSLVVEELTVTDIEALPSPPEPPYIPQVGDILNPITPEQEIALGAKLIEQGYARRWRGINVSPMVVDRAGRWPIELQIAWDSVKLGD